MLILKIYLISPIILLPSISRILGNLELISFKQFVTILGTTFSVNQEVYKVHIPGALKEGVADEDPKLTSKMTTWATLMTF